MSNVVHIEIGPYDAKVHSPFEAKDAIKRLPHGWRQWDKDEKCWVVPHFAVAELTQTLRYEGFTVRTTHTARRARQEHAPPPRSARDTSTWADGMYTALGRELADKAYKALLPVLHPDRGGATEPMQQLNAARDKAQQLRRTG